MKESAHPRQLRTAWTTRVVSVSAVAQATENDINVKLAELNRLKFNVTSITIEHGLVFIFAQKLAFETQVN